MRISIVIPTHDMENRDFFLKRLHKSLQEQTFKEFEVIEATGGSFAKSTNMAINDAAGDIIKVICMDDYLSHPDSLKVIADSFNGGWLVTGCDHDDGKDGHYYHYPEYNHQIHLGRNSIGAPSVLAFENKSPLFFDETMEWLVDCDYYKRLHERYGAPTLLSDINVTIGIHEGQETKRIQDAQRREELEYMIRKYETN